MKLFSLGTLDTEIIQRTDELHASCSNYFIYKKIRLTICARFLILNRRCHYVSYKEKRFLPLALKYCRISVSLAVQTTMALSLKSSIHVTYSMGQANELFLNYSISSVVKSQVALTLLHCFMSACAETLMA